ncbi:alcohol dehydrogenase catalytic domain-containing protein [Mycolicibacterium sp. CBMA 226]|uniref:alcohol dehydrogenase catalytic domain-containing protein n=1 Tax=Mycolicibacterium sp. CBMA 226 TaxID=2606611 RepID=UPI0012DDCCE4|nr:alcohol dehydrogenase catalytic domain-containing protein [Mycolicibacterium sp. CBMA 226]MUL76280.1 alcohol dehydrogenase catalytic domain-containing protein [Mycolicibacterium sp. CBMA 226]
MSLRRRIVKAWVLDEVGSALRLTDLEVPRPAQGQVLVKVRGAGICHSDLGYIYGVLPFQVPLPVVLGHEVSGEVVECGESVAGVRPGDAVVSAVCHTDAPGITRNGGYAEYTLMTADKVVPIPSGVDFAKAAAATDAGVTSYTAVVIHGKVGVGDRVGIVGLGGLGLTGARIAVVTGASVIGVEPNKDVWPIALESGVSQVVSDIEELAGQNLDVIVDFAGFGTTTAGAVRAVKPEGTVVLVGLGVAETTLNSLDLISRNIAVRGSTPSGVPEHLQALLAMVAAGDLDIATTEIGFGDIPESLDRLARGEVKGRVVALIDS